MYKKSTMCVLILAITCMSVAFIWAFVSCCNALTLNAQSKALRQQDDDIDIPSIGVKMIYDDDGNYIKIQNRMSMDWSASDKDWLLLIMDLNGGTIEDRATTMILALDYVSYRNISIPQYVVNKYGPTIRLKYDDIDSDEKAYDLVVNKGWDETGAIERDGNYGKKIN